MVNINFIFYIFQPFRNYLLLILYTAKPLISHIINYFSYEIKMQINDITKTLLVVKDSTARNELELDLLLRKINSILHCALY